MIYFAFPYRVGADGVTALTGRDDHIRDMIEQILFTRKGERINRPDFGAGVADLLFSENAPEIAAAVQHMVQAALQQWLAGVIEVLDVDARASDNVLAVTVSYRTLDEAADHVLTLTRPL